MSTKPVDVVAHHEAGHAVIDLWFEHPIDRITIVADGDAAGSVMVDRNGDEALRYEDELLSQVSDRLLIADYLDELDAPTEDIRDAYQRLLQLRTERIIDLIWHQVEIVAQ